MPALIPLKLEIRQLQHVSTIEGTTNDQKAFLATYETVKNAGAKTATTKASPMTADTQKMTNIIINNHDRSIQARRL